MACRFGALTAVDGVSFRVAAGEVHALLGPNGAGKTTLIRMLSGLQAPTEGAVRVLGEEVAPGPGAGRRRIGLVPSGDRSFYLRLSGQENLVFFGRLHGWGRREALSRAQGVLAKVGLADAARQRVGTYSHGMQKRLSVARALLTDPAILLVDEATHDLDPEGSRMVRELVEELARAGAAVVWATQRIDEIRGFAERVTLLNRGTVRFSGTVAELMEHASPRSYLLRVLDGGRAGVDLRTAVEAALGTLAHVASNGQPEHLHLRLADDVVLSDAIVALADAGIRVSACREERSELEEAFLQLARSDG